MSFNVLFSFFQERACFKKKKIEIPGDASKQCSHVRQPLQNV